MLILMEAGVCVTCAKVLVHSIAFRYLTKMIGRQSVESPELIDAAGSRVMTDVGWALRAIGRRVETLRQCLPQAIAAHWMARRRKVTSTIYLGTRREAGTLSAHAWLRAGNRFVVGGESRAGHHVIAAFGDR